MTMNSKPAQGSLIGHVLKRIFLAALGYLISVIVGLMAIVAIYSLLSYLPGSPAYFKAMSMTPIAMLLIPPLWLFVIFITIVTTMVPALIAMLAGEIFALRSSWLNMLFGAGVGLIGFILLTPQTEGVDGAPAWADLSIVAAAGLVGGFVYWLIAGRDAGFRRPV